MFEFDSKTVITNLKQSHLKLTNDVVTLDIPYLILTNTKDLITPGW